MAKAVVLGAGVVGVSSAYELVRAGFEVEVIDAREGVGLETTFANGGQIAANHCEPWAKPGVMVQAIKWLGRKDAPLLYHLRLDPALWAWSLRFMANATEPRFWANVAVILRMALYSRDALKALDDDIKLEFDRLDRGILNIFRNEKAFADAAEASRAIGEMGCERQVLNAAQCIELEPALHGTHDNIVGGTYSPHDLTGDAYAFTHALYERARERGVSFRFNTRVERINAEAHKVTSVTTSAGEVTGDVFVLALGCGSMKAVRGLGVTLPIVPAKGYSVTMVIKDMALAPDISITDDEHKLVVTRLGNRLRAAGTAEFAGFDDSIDERRGKMTLDAAMTLFPGAADAEQAEYWAGLRPSTPDGIPVLGRGKHENLIFNTGHGTLGWTLATGSARIVAQLAQGLAPEIDLAGLGPERFN